MPSKRARKGRIFALATLLAGAFAVANVNTIGTTSPPASHNVVAVNFNNKGPNEAPVRPDGATLPLFQPYTL